MRKIFFGIITPKDFKWDSKLIAYLIVKCMKNRTQLGAIFQQIKPCEARIIIHKGYKIPKPKFRRNWTRTPNICVD